MGYSIHSKAYRIYKDELNIKESIHGIFYESNDGELSGPIVHNLNLNKNSNDEEEASKDVDLTN